MLPTIAVLIIDPPTNSLEAQCIKVYGDLERLKNLNQQSTHCAPFNNRIEQDHQAIKRWVRPILGFKSMVSARAILGGLEKIHMMGKGQAKYACARQPSFTEQFHLLAG